MNNSILSSRLNDLSRRDRKFNLNRGLMCCWLLAAISILGFGFFMGLEQWVADRSFSLFWGLVGMAVIGVYLMVRTRTYDYNLLARKVEEEHPELKEILRTAVEQEANSESGALSYLQTRVIDEAVEKTGVLTWGASVSPERLRFMRNLQFFALLAFLIVLIPVLQVVSKPGMMEVMVKGEPVVEDVPFEWAVEPGHAEIERGERLVITARFSDRIPDEATLVIEKDGDLFEKVAMKRHLKDAVFGGVLAEVNEALTYRVEFESERSENYAITVYSHPRLESVDATVRPPAFTGLDERIEEDTRYVQAIKGSGVELRLHLNKPIAEGSLKADGSEDIPLAVDPDNPQIVIAHLSATEKQTFGVYLADEKGREQKSIEHILVEVRDNAPPRIKITFPARDLEASPLQEIHVAGEMQDDIGLESYGLSYMFRGEEKTVELGKAALGKDKKDFRHTIALETHAAEPNDLLTYYFWAEDQVEQGKSRRVESDMFFVEVHHFEEIFREGMAQQGQPQESPSMQSQQLMKDQKQILNATWKLKRRDDVEPDLPHRAADIAEVKNGQAQVLEKSQGMMEEIQDQQMRAHLLDAMDHMDKAINELATAGEVPSPLLPALSEEQKAYESLVKMRGREFTVMRNQQQQSASSRSSQSAQQRQLKSMKLRQKDRNYETEKQASLERQRRAQQQRDTLQVLNRLRELARRQDEMSDKLKELQAALEEADTESDEEKLARELKRLRDEQRQLLQDVDEARKKLNEQEQEDKREDWAQAEQKLEETRERVRQTAENLEKEQISKAVNSSTRAQRELEEIKDDFRKQAANQFREEMRELKAKTEKLDAEQQQISQELDKAKEKDLAGNENVTERKRLITKLNQQKDQVGEVAKAVQEVSMAAEESEPLLSRKLYDSLRDMHSENVEGALAQAGEALRRNRLPQADEADEQVQRGIRKLADGIEEAARTVLGDEAAGLELAREELNNLIRALDEEVSANSGRQPRAPNRPLAQNPGEDPSDRSDQTDPTDTGHQPGEQAGDEPSQPPSQADPQRAQQGEESGQQPGPQPGQGEQQSAESGQQPGKQPGQQPGQGEQQSAQEGQQPGQQPGQSETPSAQSGQQPGQQPGQQSGRQPGQQPGQGEQQSAQQGQQPGQGEPQSAQQGQPSGQPGMQDIRRGGDDRFGGGPRRSNRLGAPEGEFVENPLTGERFTDWVDQLRDVEEALEDPDLRNETAKILDRAKAVRAEFKRHGKNPEWAVVDSGILGPMVELRERVLEELSKLDAEDSLTPIDRDPVADPFRDSVRRYYEALGEGR